VTGNVAVALGRRISHCSQCGTALPLCESPMPHEARMWLCGVCGRVYQGQLATNYKAAELRNVRPEPVLFDRSQIPQPSKALLDATWQLRPFADNEFRDKRRSSRHAVTMVIPTQPFDHLLRPAERPCMLFARNISTGGICLLSDRAHRAAFFGLELSAPGGDLIQVLVQVLRARPRGSCYEIGGEFITKMANRPASTS
jgi:hypothetical protein